MPAWTCNTDTYAMSDYEPFQYRDVTVIDGALYAVSDAGIVALDADTDEGDGFAGRIEWGLLDFGDERLKRPSYAYIGYESAGVAFFTLGYNATGFEDAAEYELPYRVADDYAAGRFRLGRGIRSRYFRPGFVSEPGYALAVHRASLFIDMTSRRI